MIQVRPNTFETNSSSSHSLVVTKKDNGRYTIEEATDELWLDNEGVWRPSPYGKGFYFGRHPFRVLTTFKEKLLYAYANVPVRRRQNSKGQTRYYRQWSKVTNVVKQLIPEFTAVKWGYEWERDVTPPTCDDYCLFGWLKKWNMSLEEYLLNKNVVVICDGDEYCIFTDMMKLGMVEVEKRIPTNQWYEEEVDD